MGICLANRAIRACGSRQPSLQLFPQRAGVFKRLVVDDAGNTPSQEDDFHLVDSKPMQRGRGQRRFQPNRFQNQQRRDGDKRNEGPGDKRRQQQQQQQRNRMGGYRDNQRVRITHKPYHYSKSYETSKHTFLSTCRVQA